MKTLKVGVDKLPAPRLQLRWEPYKSGPGARMDDEFYGYNWQCFYELVLPLGEFDRRRTIYNEDGDEVSEQEELVKLMGGPTRRSSTSVPCHYSDGSIYPDCPVGDGYHAFVDSQILGNLPIYVIDPYGNAYLKEWDNAG